MKKALKYLISVIIAIIVAGFFIYLLILSQLLFSFTPPRLQFPFLFSHAQILRDPLKNVAPDRG